MVADLRMPPQLRQGGSSSPARTRSSARSMGARSSHRMQTTSRRVPWISTTSSGEVPAAWWRPSTFWVRTAWSLPRRSSSTTALWPSLGSTFQPPMPSGSRRLCQERLRASGVRHVVRQRVASFSASGFFGSTGRLGPRKSGMPESVEMPAPVSTTIRSGPRRSRSAPRRSRCRLGRSARSCPHCARPGGKRARISSTEASTCASS